MRADCRTIALGFMFIGTLAGCGGNEFRAGGAGGMAVGAGGASSNGGTSAGAAIGGQASGAGGTSSGSTTIGPDTCDTPSSDAVDVYVDMRYAGATSTGSHNCPLLTILDGVNAPMTAGIKRTIHVAGASSGLLYQESNRILVGPGVTLLGDGSDKVKIAASGACATRTCAVHTSSCGSPDSSAYGDG